MLSLLLLLMLSREKTNDIVFIYYQGKVFGWVLDFTSKDGFNAS